MLWPDISDYTDDLTESMSNYRAKFDDPIYWHSGQYRQTYGASQ